MACLLTGAAAASAAPVAGDAMSGASGLHVSIGYASYAPEKVDVLVGDSVSWHNDSVRGHTVTDDANAYDSGTLPTGSGYAHIFASTGSFPYHCRLHAGINGEVDAWKLLLDPVGGSASTGQPFPLHGRAALPAQTVVSIEADQGAGAGFKRVADATVGDDGRFVATVAPTESATYRAVVGEDRSPSVQLLVLNHEIAVHARRSRRSTAVSVQVTPADPGALVVLQLHLRERFGWWPVARARLDRNSRAHFDLRLDRAVSARAVLTLGDGATRLGSSSVVRVGPR